MLSINKRCISGLLYQVKQYSRWLLKYFCKKMNVLIYMKFDAAVQTAEVRIDSTLHHMSGRIKVDPGAAKFCSEVVNVTCQKKGSCKK